MWVSMTNKGIHHIISILYLSLSILLSANIARMASCLTKSEAYITHPWIKPKKSYISYSFDHEELLYTMA